MTPLVAVAAAIIRYASRQRDQLPGWGDDPTAEQVWEQLADDAKEVAAILLAALELREETATKPKQRRAIPAPWPMTGGDRYRTSEE